MAWPCDYAGDYDRLDTTITFHANYMARNSRLHARVREHGLCHMTAIFLVFLLSITPSYAQPAAVQFRDCFSGSNTTQKLNVSAVYAQLIPQDDGRANLNFTLVGSTPQVIVEASSDQNNPVASTPIALLGIDRH